MKSFLRASFFEKVGKAMGVYKNIKNAIKRNNIEKQENKEQGPKYEFTGELREIDGVFSRVTLHRIRALRDIEGDIERGISDVKAGELGGWIEDEKNLSHRGNAWVADEAKVFDNACVLDNARVEESAVLCYEATAEKNARIYGNAWVEDSFISDYAKVHGHSTVSAQSSIYENAEVCAGAHIYLGVQIYGHAKVSNGAMIYNNAKIYDNAVVRGPAVIKGNVQVYNNSNVTGFVTGNAQICGDAIICADAIVAGNARINHGKIDNAIISGGTKVYDTYTEEKTVDNEHGHKINIREQHSLKPMPEIEWEKDSEGFLNPDFSFELNSAEIDIEP